MAAGKGHRKWTWGAAVLCVALLMATGLFLYIYFGIIPRDDIALLKDGYVAASYGNGAVRYEIVAARPEAWTSLDALSRETRAAFLTSEDWRFYHHAGFDVIEIKNALIEAVREGKRPRGASTIPQQIAKNLFLSRDYSVRRKLKELAIAMYMDGVLPKDRILEIYMNIVEFGEGIYGITHAAEFYFGKSPAGLTPKEAAFLAMLLPNPKANSQSYRDRSLTPKAEAAISSSLATMHRLGYLSEHEWQQQLAAPMQFRTP